MLQGDVVKEVPQELRGPCIVSGIIEPTGAMRVVCCTPDTLWPHPARNELCLTVPGFMVRTPVPWDSIPWVIEQAFTYADWWIQTRNARPNDGCFENIQNYIKLRKADPAAKTIWKEVNPEDYQRSPVLRTPLRPKRRRFR